MFENILQQKGFWEAKGKKNDTVLSSRIRLARNTTDLPFPENMELSECKDIFQIASTINEKLVSSYETSFYKISDINDSDRRFLRERNIITDEVENSSSSAVIISSDCHLSIMINGKDHFRIQFFESGLDLFSAYKKINIIDDLINEEVPYAFSDKFGYLTSDLNSTGTGLKASVLLHLPMIKIMKSEPEVKTMAEEMFCSFKAVTGNISKNFSSMYIISNKTSIGKSETDIIEQVDDLCEMISDLENEIRDDYMYDSGFLMKDRVWRSYGLLKYSKNLNYPESLEYLSNLRIGIILSIIRKIDLDSINDLMVKIQYAHLEKIKGEPFVSPFECDEYRAFFIKKNLPDLNPEE